MKTILIIIAFLFVGNITSFSQVISPCNDENCTDPYHSASKTFYMPCCPNCPITVNYLWHICNGAIEIEIQSIGYNNPVTPFCASLVSWLYDQGSSFDNIKQMYHLAYEEIAKQTFMIEYNSLPANVKYLLECPNGNRKYGFTVASCTHYCGYNDFAAQMSRIVQLSCNATNCCKIEYRICWNTTTQQVDVVRTTTLIGTPNCPTTPPECPATYPAPGIYTTGQAPPDMIFDGRSTPCGISCE